MFNDIEEVKKCINYLFCVKTFGCINLSSVGERFLYQMACISLIKTFPFFKHLRFHLDVVLGHANWANLIISPSFLLGKRHIFGTGQQIKYLMTHQMAALIAHLCRKATTYAK